MKIYNNLSRQLEEFEPLRAPRVFVYSCGPTVYDFSHIGHARSAIAWDVLARYLRYSGYEVKWIRNITNVDDKIINRAKALKCSSDQLSRRFTYEFWNDMTALNVSWPEFEPRATDYIAEIINFIQELIDKDFAYQAGGDVYFKASKFKSYGQLKGQSPEDLRKGIARVAENERKEDVLDFALWKAFPDDTASSFHSPWGFGRPGWHIECSAMIRSILAQEQAGCTLDIHAGGDDLIFPHHENECAQSEALNCKSLAKYWMHNGMVMVNGAKMSKSENNFMTIKDVLKDFKANTIRFFCLSTHYKKQINFTHEALKAAEVGFDKLFQHICVDSDKENLDENLIAEFRRYMDDDLSTPQALALLFDNKHKPASVAYLLSILGFDLDFKQSSHMNAAALGASLDLLLEFREQARLNRDFATSDRIRDTLSASGILIKDHKDKPSSWELSQ
jgi:cysteinyl-tRNA synthetase